MTSSSQCLPALLTALLLPSFRCAALVTPFWADCAEIVDAFGDIFPSDEKLFGVRRGVPIHSRSTKDLLPIYSNTDCPAFQLTPILVAKA